MSDSFPASLEVLFRAPANLDDDLTTAVTQLAETLKADLVSSGAPVEVVMEASVCVSQFAKHMQASRQPYGYPEQGGYSDPGAERAALSSLHNGLSSLRDAMAKLRNLQVRPEQAEAAVRERDGRWTAAMQAMFQRCRQQQEELTGEDLMFFVQSTLFEHLRSEGIAE